MKLVEEERRQHELLREELIMQGLRNVPTAVTHKEQVETTTSSILLLSKHRPLSLTRLLAWSRAWAGV